MAARAPPATVLPALSAMPLAMPVAVFMASLARPVARLLPVSMAVFLAASFIASVAMVWNCWVRAPHHCMGSTTPAAGALAAFVLVARALGAFAAGFSVWKFAGGISSPEKLLALSATRCTPPAMLSATLSLKALATSPILKFMPLSVASVIFCTSSAWIVAFNAVAFWSSQNCTALSSSMRLSSSSTLSVGATQLPRLGNCGIFCAALPAAWVARFCKKSKPGTNLPKPGKEGLSASLMLVSWRVVQYCICLDACPACAWQSQAGTFIVQRQRASSTHFFAFGPRNSNGGA